MDNIKQVLLNEKNENFKKFSEKIISSKYPIIGIKADVLKKLAKNNINEYQKYFQESHEYYEEYMIHGLMLGYLKIPYETLIPYINQYIQFIDNWSMVDSVVANLKIFKKHLKEIFIYSKQLINCNEEFKARFGYCILLTYFVNNKQDEYIDEILSLCNKNHEAYYIQMMVAWLLSVAYIKYPEKTLNYFKNNKLDNFTFNKTISKICDSYRVTIKEKEILKQMRRK